MRPFASPRVRERAKSYGTHARRELCGARAQEGDDIAPRYLYVMPSAPTRIRRTIVNPSRVPPFVTTSWWNLPAKTRIKQISPWFQPCFGYTPAVLLEPLECIRHLGLEC